MRLAVLSVGACVLLVGCAAPPSSSESVPRTVSLDTAATSPSVTMELTSSAFLQEGLLPARYTCDGEGVSPPLTFSNVPKGAQSLMLIVSDPDAPRGDFVHWVVYDIDPVPLNVAEGSIPSGGAQGIVSTGTMEYVPPCPLSGVHRYFFRLYALDISVRLEVSPTKADLLTAMEGHALAEAELMGRYGR